VKMTESRGVVVSGVDRLNWGAAWTGGRESTRGARESVTRGVHGSVTRGWAVAIG
jgi:hypothetical protein